MHKWDACNVFRRKREPILWCAVPQHRPVPEFIQGDPSDFDSTITDPMMIPLGFQPKAAMEAMRVLGFYLFQALPGRPSAS